MLRKIRSLLRREDGSSTPSFLALTFATVVAGVLFLQTGRATDLGAKAQTGADAAALAAATDIGEQIMEWMRSGSWNRGPFILNQPRALADAYSYASRNNVRITSVSIRPVGPLMYEVDVEAMTNEVLEPISPGGITVGNRQRGLQNATARVGPGAGSSLARGFATDGNGQDFGTTPERGTRTSGGCALSDGEIMSLADAAGVSVTDPRNSVLGRYTSCDGGVSIQPMPDEMKISLLRLEAAMGTPLQLSSGYRSPEYQAQLCKRVTGMCATPGRSMHNIGMAVDVANWQLASQYINDPSIGLCQPFPSNDAVHFSHATGRECGGNIGTAGVGRFAPFGGTRGLTGAAMISVSLVD